MQTKRHLYKIFFVDLLLIEFGPVGVFFLTYWLTDFPRAALALAVATIGALTLSRVINARVPWFALMSGVVTMTTALVTYFFDAPWVLIVRDTVYYTVFALLVGVGLVLNRFVFKLFFGHIFALTDEGWRLLEVRWLVFFMLAAIANEWVRSMYSVEGWVVYKQLVTLLFVVFGFYQLTVTARFRTDAGDRLGFRL